MRATVNKIFMDRRAGKPRWFCRVVGGVGPNADNLIGVAYGCARWLAYRRAVREFRKASR